MVRELAWCERELASAASSSASLADRVVFGHNDLLSGNMLLKTNETAPDAAPDAGATDPENEAQRLVEAMRSVLERVARRRKPYLGSSILRPTLVAQFGTSGQPQIEDACKVLEAGVERFISNQGKTMLTELRVTSEKAFRRLVLAARSGIRSQFQEHKKASAKAIDRARRASTAVSNSPFCVLVCCCFIA